MDSVITNWENWIVGIFSSAIPMGVAILWGYAKLWRPYSKFQKMGVVKIFTNQKEAEQCIVEECQNSKKLRVFAMRGETFSDEENSTIAKEVQQRAKLKQLYLISSANDNEYLSQRAKLLEDPDLIDGVKKSISCLTRASKDHSNIELKLHKEDVRFRIILLDNYLFLSVIEDKRAKQTEILKISKNSSFYKTYSKIFDELWEKYPIVKTI